MTPIVGILELDRADNRAAELRRLDVHFPSLTLDVGRFGDHARAEPNRDARREHLFPSW